MHAQLKQLKMTSVYTHYAHVDMNAMISQAIKLIVI